MNVQIQPTQGMQSLADRSAVTAWLNHLQVLMPPHRVMLVGAGSASGRWVQWLQQANVEAASLVEAADEAFHSLQALVSTKPSWRASKEVIGPDTQVVTFYVASVGSESGLLEPESQQGIWPNIKTRQKQERQAITLSEAMRADEVTADWLLLDCSPALPLLTGAGELLTGVHVILARTELPAAGEQGESQELAGLKQHLSAAGFRLVCTEPGRHPALGHALWVRQTQSDSERLRPQLEAALKERAAQAHAEQLQAQLLQVKEAQTQQRRATEELKEALEKALAAAQAEKAALSKERAEMVVARDKVEKLANERQARIKLLDQRLQILQTQLNDNQGRYRSLQAELLKAEAQIELIKAFVLRDPAQ